MRTWHVYIEIDGRVRTQVVRAQGVIGALAVAANTGTPHTPGRALLWADEVAR